MINIRNFNIRKKLKELILTESSIDEKIIILNSFVLQGWDRLGLYKIALNIMKKDTLTEYEEECFYDFIKDLIGYCPPNRIFRLSNEPSDPFEFENYLFKINFPLYDQYE